MKRSKSGRRLHVSTDGKGLVSHAGTGLLRTLTQKCGLVAGWSRVLIGTYKLPPLHQPGQVLADLAVTIADGGDTMAHLRTLRDQPRLFDLVASDPTAYRVVEKVDQAALAQIRAARTAARTRVWAAGGGPDLAAGLVLRFDASLLDAHSEKQGATPTWKKGFGFHPLLCFLDRPDVAGAEALAGLLRPGRAGSNTATDHISVLEMAIAALPEHARPGIPDAPSILVTADAAGATHGFAAALHTHAMAFSLGFGLHEDVQNAIIKTPEAAYTPAYNRDQMPRRGAWVAEITGLLDLSKWPPGSRVIIRRERPHPGAQFTFTDIDGHRFTAFITNTIGAQLADLELRHRTHARVEDAIRTSKDTGMTNLPFHGWDHNACWLELALTAADLLTWTRALCFTGSLATAEPATLRYKILHTAGQLIRTGRRIRLKLDQTWPWTEHLKIGYDRLHHAFARQPAT